MFKKAFLYIFLDVSNRAIQLLTQLYEIFVNQIVETIKLAGDNLWNPEIYFYFKLIVTDLR